MIVRKLRVEGWQCFADPIDVGPFGNGLNIIYGPNGIGKSTLFRALVRGLCDTHRTKGKDMELLRPWGRDLTPTVTIDFDHDNVSYRLRKQFLQSNAAEVQRSEDGRLVRLYEGQKADDFVRQLLFVEGPKTGATKGAEHWGIAQVLWSQQGELKLDALSNPVRSSLQQALGAQVTTAAADQTTQRIAQQYNAWFTSTGRLKSGGDAAPAVAIEQQLKAAQEQLRKLRLSLNEYDDAVHRIENLRLTAEQKRLASKQLEELHSAAIDKSNAYSKLIHERDAREKDSQAARAQFDQLDAQLKSIQAARRELVDYRQQIDKIASDLPAIQKDLEQCNVTWERARQARDTIVRQRDVVDQARQQAQQALQFEQLHKSHAALTEKLSQLQTLQTNIDRLQTQASVTVAPDAKALKAIQTALKQRDDAQLRLSASLITLEIVAESDLAWEVLAAEQVRPPASREARRVLLQGSPEVAIRLPGVGVLRARGPQGSVDELRQQRTIAQQALDRLVAGYQFSDIEDLQQQSEQAQLHRRELDDLRLRFNTLLGNQTHEAVQNELAKQAAQLQELLQHNPEWQHAAPQPQQLQVAADAIARQFKLDIDAAESQRDLAQSAQTAANNRLIAHESKLRELRSLEASALQRLESATADNVSDEARATKLSDAAIRWAAAKAGLQAAEEKLAAQGGDPRNDTLIFERQMKAAQGEADKASESLIKEQVRLESLINEAPYSAIASEEENVARLEAQWQRETLQLNAIKLLHETIDTCQRELVESLVGPIRSRTTHTLARIAGTRFSRIEIGDDFATSGIVPRDSTDAVRLEELSGGEQEQVYFAIRLALADVVFPEGQQLVVFDDVFTFTDAPRLARIIGILQEVAQRFQIVVLTCHPERYRGLDDATFFDLEEIQRSSHA